MNALNIKKDQDLHGANPGLKYGWLRFSFF